MFCGMFISTVGASMIWPFLMLYVSEKLQVPLTTAAALATLNAAVGVLSSFIGGPITDKFGRKGVMVFSLIANGLAYAVMSRAGVLTVAPVVPDDQVIGIQAVYAGKTARWYMTAEP